MKKLEIIEKIPKLPLPSVTHSDAQVILRLVTILAATHLANKVSKQTAISAFSLSNHSRSLTLKA